MQGFLPSLWGDRKGFAVAGFGKPNPQTFRKRKVGTSRKGILSDYVLIL